MVVSQCNCWIAHFHPNTTSSFPFWRPEVAISPARTSVTPKVIWPSRFAKQLMESKTGPHLSTHSFWFNGPMRNKRRKSHASAGSNYRPDPGENGQYSLVLAGGSCIWVIWVMQAIRTSPGGLLMGVSHFIAALVVQSGHSTHALPHQLPKTWGTRTEGQEMAGKSGEQRSYLGLSESFSFSKFAIGAA